MHRGLIYTIGNTVGNRRGALGGKLLAHVEPRAGYPPARGSRVAYPALTVSAADWVLPSNDPVIVTPVSAVTEPACTVKVALAAPSGTTTLPGTDATVWQDASAPVV